MSKIPYRNSEGYADPTAYAVKQTMLPGVTWDKSPVCLPKLLESEDKGRA